MTYRRTLTDLSFGSPRQAIPGSPTLEEKQNLGLLSRFGAQEIAKHDEAPQMQSVYMQTTNNFRSSTAIFLGPAKP